MERRGTLRIYLGYAPGVGKTFAMLSEGLRRAERGARTVIGHLAPTHRQPVIALASRLGDPRRAGVFDVATLLAERPAVVLVDELAGPPSPGGGGAQRWEDVDLLLENGSDVVTTLAIGEIESLRDVVAGIVGVRTQRSVPDHFVRGAQVELVDMSPEALRRRIAHGNVYAPGDHDAVVADRVRPANLHALRELSLSWLADRVEEHQSERTHAATTPATRERVVVAVGRSSIDGSVVRRAARLAARTRAPLVAVHVVPPSALPSAAVHEPLDDLRQLVADLGGTYREIVGAEVADSLVRFAEAERATQLVVGTPAVRGSRRDRRWRAPLAHAVLDAVARSDIDVHVVPRLATPVGTVRPAPPRRHRSALPRRHRSALPTRRRRSAWLLLLFGLPTLTVALLRFPDHISLASALLVYLAFVLAVAALGGLLRGLVAALTAFGLCNWFFVPPRHTFTIAGVENLVALLVFVMVAGTVSALVDRVSARSREAQLARAEAETLARSTITVAGEHDPLDHLLSLIASTFGADALSLLVRTGDGGWVAEARHGDAAPATPAEGTAIALDAAGTELLVLRGRPLTADDHRVLTTIATHLRLARDARLFQEAASRLDALAEADSLRTALLQAVSHDLRTPLAAIKAAASALLAGEVTWSDEQRTTLLTTVDAQADRLNRIIGNLLDMSRLQAGVVRVERTSIPVEEVVTAAIASLAPAPRVAVDVRVDARIEAHADGALVERALANVIGNAIAHSPVGGSVRIDAARVRDEVQVRVADRGPGIPTRARGRVFEPFQRLGDGGGAGVGLGLAVARGLLHATGASIELDDTPGGGCTATIHLPGAGAVNTGSVSPGASADAAPQRR